MDGSLVIMVHSLLQIFLLLKWMVALSLQKVVGCRDFFYSNGWQPCHYGRQSIVEIFVTPFNGSLLNMEGSLLLISLLLQWMVAQSYGRQFVYEILVTLMDGSLVIMEGSLLSRFLLFQWMVALSLQKVVYYRDFCHYNGWQPCHYGRQSVVKIFVTIMDCSLVVMEGSLLSISLLVQWMVAQHYGR